MLKYNKQSKIIRYNNKVIGFTDHRNVIHIHHNFNNFFGREILQNLKDDVGPICTGLNTYNLYTDFSKVNSNYNLSKRDLIIYKCIQKKYLNETETH